MGVPEIFDGYPGDFWWMCWKYFIGSWRYLMGVLEIFDCCPGDI